MTQTSGRRLRHLSALAVAAALLAGCSGGAESAGSDAESAGGDAIAVDTAASQQLRDRAGATPAALETQEKVVSTGTVAVSSRHVERALRRVSLVVDQYGGQVGNERTETDDDGAPVWARLVVRVPVEEFDGALADLKQIGRLQSSSRRSTVVTAEYVDLEARVRAQERSLRRVELLYRRAQSIRDIMAIEGEVATRQAELDSLKGRLRVLDDKTQLSTITVHVEQRTTATAPEPEQAGFLAGLRAGWDGLTGLLVGAATLLGAVLPFTLVLLPLGLLAWLGLRRFRNARRPA